MFHVEETQVGEFNRVTLTGNIDKTDIESFEEHFKTILARNPSEIILDLSHYSWLPLHFTYFLFKLVKIYEPSQGKLEILNMPSHFRFILETAQLDTYFSFRSSLDFLQIQSSPSTADTSHPIPNESHSAPHPVPPPTKPEP